MSDYPFMIEGNPDYAFLTVKIPAGRTLRVEAASMACMDPHVIMKTKLQGGFKRFLGGESLLLNDFSAAQSPGSISIGPGPAGDIAHYSASDENPILLASGAYLAASDTVSFDTKWEGFTKGFFSGGGLFLLKSKGSGDVWFNSYGALIELDLEDEYVVDTGHIVAFTAGLTYDISRVGGYKSLFFSGEGLVCRFRGRGKVWIQTRNPARLVAWAQAYRAVEKSN